MTNIRKGYIPVFKDHVGETNVHGPVKNLKQNTIEGPHVRYIITPRNERVRATPQQMS